MSKSELMRQFVSEKAIKEIDSWIKKYPADQKQSAVMQALMLVQEALGYLTEPAMDAVAAYLEMPAVAVYEMASFYSMYRAKPAGRHMINVCTTITCRLKGAPIVVDALQKKLGVTEGETTKDGRFTLCSVECLGACVNAPMMQVDKNYHENLTVDTLDSVLAEYP
ncbi:MAG: NADH-quinone oxidoreductase subunit NuoE [Gammaproteobacteria bacterium]|nr:NADH-quinone oxidoreductase subunit NuoE [Gammaproteobacteria bacterium]MCH9716624.1 NADH-quinone oxidoreductase subunit NuoE [Gammaproteobacteria bacterium]MCH9763851.1 NADH-quinone oxidoreductase subunit NuoE [Gammaproteobacteria bacterium]